MSTIAEVWVVDDDDSIRWVLERALSQAGIKSRSYSSGEAAMQELESGFIPGCLLVDIRMPDMSGLDLLERIRTSRPNLPVIIMTAHSDLESAISSHEGGAFDYLPKPFDIEEAITLIKKGIRWGRDRTDMESTTDQDPVTVGPELIGKAPAMQQVFRAIGRLSNSDLTVLITGESGTGKELIARALHRHNPRSRGPFIAINTAAIPQALLESELFGHERGAFTGAQGLRKGRFEQATGGTLFLDEIGDMPMDLQTRLLRVLANGEIYRVGGQQAIKTNVRIIAATHQNLRQLIANGSFREDLYHRLNVINVHSPALRERREDLLQLTDHFLNQAASELHQGVKSLSEESRRHFLQCPWPGNVRQLENTCRWLTVMTPGNVIHPDDLPAEIISTQTEVRGEPATDWQSTFRKWVATRISAGETGIYDIALPEVERILIACALEQTRGKRQEAAKLLGWGRNTLTRKIKDLSL